MIKITKKEDCCGCNACVQRCPKSCIAMSEDEEGFLYPSVNEDICIECGLCEKVCPIINQSEARTPIKVYAAKNPDEKIRMCSSSGGIFTMLAECIINSGGVVFGAKFNTKWEVVHDYAHSIDSIAPFRGSKYVQSAIGNSFIDAESFLKAGRVVLFTGTPCQIAGLNKFLRKEYVNLITVDIICHGVPSPLVWQDYLKHIARDEKIISINFRDKSTGWKTYSTKYELPNKILQQKASDDIFIQGFLNDLYLRPSCHSCPAKSGKSGSDITIADFWGISNYNKSIDDGKGVSCILINSENGKRQIANLEIESISVPYSIVQKYNSAIEKSVPISKFKYDFWERYQRLNILAIKYLCDKIRPSMIVRCVKRSKAIFNKFGNK